MKYEIEIPDLPEGWKPVAYKEPTYYDNVLLGKQIVSSRHIDVQPGCHLIVEKIKPMRRIILEETDEMREIESAEWGEEYDGNLFRWNLTGRSSSKYKIWREVKDGE